MEKRNHRIEITVNEEEKSKIRQKAEKIGLSVTSFSRHVLLNCKVNEVEVKIIKG